MHRTAILKPFTTLLLLGSMLCISPAGWAQGICDRTPQVRDRLIALIPGTPDCADVTAAHLGAIRTSIFFSSQKHHYIEGRGFCGPDYREQTPPGPECQSTENAACRGVSGAEGWTVFCSCTITPVPLFP